MRTLPLLLAATLLAPSAALALDPQEAGEIEAQIEDGQRQVKEKFGNRTLREMDSQERRDYDRALNEAREQVLQKHGTTLRGYESQRMKFGREAYQESQAARQGWGEKKKQQEEASKAEAAKKAKGDGEIKVQQGFDENNPPNVEDVDGVQVQRGRGSEGIEIPVPQEGEGGEPAEGGAE